MANNYIETIKQLFEEMDFSYFCKEEGGRVGTILSKGALFFEVCSSTIECQYVLKRKIPVDQCDQVMEYINHINMMLREGHVEIDKDGVVKCRLVTDISEDQNISKDRLASMLIKAMQTELRYGDGLYEIVEGRDALWKTK